MYLFYVMLETFQIYYYLFSLKKNLNGSIAILLKTK